MRRYPLVLAGTAAGIAAVLTFPTHRPHIDLPTGSAEGGVHPAASAAPASGVPSTTRASGRSRSEPSVGAPTTTTPRQSATSQLEPYPYGELAVRVTAVGARIVGVSMTSLTSNDPHSSEIDDYAVPLLEQQVLKAHSADIAGISGATFTSQAFVDGVANALQKLGITT